MTPTSSQRSTSAGNRGISHLRPPLLASTSTPATAKHSPSSVTRIATLVTDTAAKQVAVTLAHGVSPASNGASDRRYSSQQAPRLLFDEHRLQIVMPPSSLLLILLMLLLLMLTGWKQLIVPLRQGAPLRHQLLTNSHILIPVSTTELFFRRFDMLQEQLDELTSLMSKKP